MTNVFEHNINNSAICFTEAGIFISANFESKIVLAFAADISVPRVLEDMLLLLLLVSVDQQDNVISNICLPAHYSEMYTQWVKTSTCLST